MKKKFGILAILLAFAMTFMVACGPSKTGDDNPPPPPPPSYDTTDTVWGAAELADTWTAGSAAGTASLDGDLVKVQTMAGYGGVKSPTFEMDFSKRVMLNIKGYTDTELTQLVVRIRFAGYSTVSTSGAYIIAENYDNMPNREGDYKNLNGDFSIDVSDAIFLYANDPWQNSDCSCLIYQEGDIDDEGNEVAADDARIGHLKFEGQKVNGYIEVWCQPGTNSGLTGEDAYVAMKEISITEEAAPAVTSFDADQEDLVKPTQPDQEDNRPTKGDAPLQLEPKITVAQGKNNGVIYASTLPDAVSVDATGKVSFNKATSGNVTVNLFPRANIAKMDMVKFSVLGNLKTPQMVDEHLNGLAYEENAADMTPDLQSLLDGDVLTAQKASFDGAVAGLQVYNIGNTMSVINAFDKTNSEAKQAATQNGGKIAFTVEKPVGEGLPDDNNWTYSLFTITAGKVLKGAQAVALANGKGAVEYRYTDGNAKITDPASMIIIWKNGTTTVGNLLQVNVFDATEIAQTLTAQQIYDTSTHNEDRSTVTFENGLVKFGLNAKGGYDELYTKLFTLEELDFKNRSVVVVLNIVEQVESYVTYRMKGTDAEGSNVTAFTNAYMHDVAGHAYNNVTHGGTLNLEIWRYLNNRADFIASSETVANSGLYLQVVSWNSQASEIPFGYIAVSGITYYYVD